MQLPREQGYTFPRDVRRRGRGRAEGDVHLRRGRRADRPEHRHVVHGARVARVPGLPGHLRDRDDEVRRRGPARVRLSGEGRHVHERRAAHPARRRRRSTPPGGAKTDFDILTDGLARARPRHRLRRRRGRDGRVRGADAALRRRHATSASGARACSGRSRRTAPTRRSSTRTLRAPRGRAQLRRAALQAARRRGRRRVPARSWSPAAACSTTTPAR